VAWIWAWMACREAEPPPEADTSPTTTSTAETAAPPTPTGDTAPEPTCPACDDGLDCSLDRCDDAGACAWEPLTDCAWPAPAVLPLVGDLPELQVSLSGAAYDPVNQRLWVVRNSGPAGIWRLVPADAGAWVVDEVDGVPAAWVALPGLGELDLEGVTVVDPVARPDEVHLVDEAAGQIVAFDLSIPGVATAVGQWDTSGPLPTLEQLGAEGLAFVPDAALAAAGFVDADGAPRTSAGGTGGLMLVGHQNGGRVYAFDLGLFGLAEHVGTYETGGRETSGLELDPHTGRLYVWHGVDNDLEVVRLSSTDVGGVRVLDREHLFDHPAYTNLEGVAIAPCDGSARALFLVTDDGGPSSLAAYPDWPCFPAFQR
jgi:hypothetical protein